MTKNNKTKRKESNKKRNKTVFRREHYNSGDGMLTTVWGPSLWHSLHTISFNYPVNPSETDKTNYMDFILGLQYVLPCGKCRDNLCKNLKQCPLTRDVMKSRNTFSKYLYRLHERINTMLGKKSGLSYLDVKERYENFRARCNPNGKQTRKKSDSEKGCTEPIYGEKSKCIIHIVPQSKKLDTFNIDKECIKKKI